MPRAAAKWCVCLERRIITHTDSGITFRVEDTRIEERKVVTNVTPFPRAMGKGERGHLVAEAGRRYLQRLREERGWASALSTAKSDDGATAAPPVRRRP